MRPPGIHVTLLTHTGTRYKRFKELNWLFLAPALRLRLSTRTCPQSRTQAAHLKYYTVMGDSRAERHHPTPKTPAEISHFHKRSRL
jgi:hypothetical protein